MKFADTFFEPRTINGYNGLLLGESETDKIGFRYYADIFYGIGLAGRQSAAILDLGCGPGYVTMEIARRMGSGSIHFLDMSPGMIAQARRNAAGLHKGISADYTIDDAANLQRHVKPGSIDLVVARHVIQLIDEPTEVFRQAYAALKPGGKFVFTLVGENIFNLSDEGNSIFENRFFSGIAYAAMQIMPYYIMQLPKEAQWWLQDRGLIMIPRMHTAAPLAEALGIRSSHFAANGKPALRKAAMLPKYNRRIVMDKLADAGIPQSSITYMILPETHTVGYKLGFSMVLGTVPIPGIWDIFPLFGMQTRLEMVGRIYNAAFGDKNALVRTHDPVFVVTKN